MTDQSLFTENKNSQETPVTNQNPSTATNTGSVQQDPFSDLLRGVTNERGEQKYSNVQEALKGLSHSQQFIDTLKSENTALKQQLEDLKDQVSRLKTVEETVTALTSGGSKGATTPDVLSEEAVAELIERTLNKKQTEATRNTNTKSVIRAITEKFGEKAESEFYSRAESAGLSRQQINELAGQSPDAVFRILGIANVGDRRTESAPSASNSSVNTSGIQPQQESFVRRNSKGVLVGATSDDFRQEFDNAKGLVNELERQGLSTYDLSDPKVYKKFFGKG